MWPQSALLLLLALTGSGCAAMDNPWATDYGPHHSYHDSWYSPAPTYYSSRTTYVVRPPHYAPSPAPRRPPVPPRQEFHGDRGRPGPQHDQPPMAHTGGPGAQHAENQRHDQGHGPQGAQGPRPQEQRSQGPQPQGQRPNGPGPGR